MRIPYLSSLCFMGRHARSSDCQIWLTRFNCIVGGYGVELTTATFFSEVWIISKNVCACSQVYNSIGDINDILLALSPLLYINCTMYIYPLFSLAHIASNPCAENRIYTRHLGGLDSSVIRKVNTYPNYQPRIRQQRFHRLFKRLLRVDLVGERFYRTNSN